VDQGSDADGHEREELRERQCATECGVLAYLAAFGFIVAFGVTKMLTKPGGQGADRPAHP
jgi:hypothetical protein